MININHSFSNIYHETMPYFAENFQWESDTLMISVTGLVTKLMSYLENLSWVGIQIRDQIFSIQRS